VFLLHVGRLTLAISRFESRNRILCEAALILLPTLLASFRFAVWLQALMSSSLIQVQRCSRKFSSLDVKFAKLLYALKFPSPKTVLHRGSIDTTPYAS